LSTSLPLWAEAWHNCANDPLLFVTGVLGLPDKFKGCPTCGAPVVEKASGNMASTCRCDGVEPWQHEVLNLVGMVVRGESHKDISIRSGHGVGKTTLEAWLVLWAVGARTSARVPVISNSQDQLRQTIWPEIVKWRNRLPMELQQLIDVQAESVVNAQFPELCFAAARTVSKDKPEALQGFHDEFIMVLVDEASGVDDSFFELATGARSTASPENVSLFLMAGNPTRSNGYFYNSHTRNRTGYHAIHVNCMDVPRATGHIEKVRQDFGEGSNAWRVRVLGEFPTADDETVIPLELAMSAVNRKIERSQFYPVWGVDVARFGSDSSALAKRQGNTLLEKVKTWRDKDSIQLAGLIKEEYENTDLNMRPSEILIDIIGVGSGVYDQCKRLALPVRGINVGEAPATRENCMRLRDELWIKGREWFLERACTIPDDDALIAELTAPVYTFTATGKMVVEPKAELKKRGLNSPDRADAFLLTFACGLKKRIDPHRKITPPRHSAWAV
jgi:phage terminase large subunit